MPGVRALHDPTPTLSGFERSRLTLLGDLADQEQRAATSRRVVAESRRRGPDARSLDPAELSEEWLRGVEGRLQERRVVTIGRGDGAPERDASRFRHRRAFDASFSSIRRAPSRFLAAARSVGYTSIHRQIGRFEADEALVSFEGDSPEPLHRPGFDPLVAPPTRSVLSASKSHRRWLR